jgi:hypothetical protein
MTSHYVCPLAQEKIDHRLASESEYKYQSQTQNNDCQAPTV